MPRFYMQIKDKYCVWSTIVDAPISEFMTKKQIQDVFDVEISSLQHRLERVKETKRRVLENGIGTDLYTRDEVLEGNRAGNNESHITEDEIYERYNV